MKTVININLGGIVFAIEQDAYDMLAPYLESIKVSIAGNSDASEIMSDIESAIAEKFLLLNRSERVAVTSDDVVAVTKEMGSPADFGEEADEVETGQGESTAEDVSSADTEPDETKRRLFRDTDDSIIAGVAAGLAKYFDTDPVIVRILFVVAVFFNGLGIFAYILFWFIVPEAKTTSQKYAMRGKRVTVEHITESVKKKLEEVDTDALMSRAQNSWGGVRPVFVKSFDVIGVLVRSLLTALKYIAGIVLVLGGALLVAGLVSAYSIVLLSDKVFLPAEAQTAVAIMISSGLGLLAIASSFVVLFIPFVILIMVGAVLLGKQNVFTTSKFITLIVVWIVAAVLAGTTSFLQAEQVMQTLRSAEGVGEYNQMNM